MNVSIDLRRALLDLLEEDANFRDCVRALVLDRLPDDLAEAEAATEAEPLLDTEAAAKLLGLTPSALRMAVYRGTIPCVRVGRRLRFRASELAG